MDIFNHPQADYVIVKSADLLKLLEGHRAYLASLLDNPIIGLTGNNRERLQKDLEYYTQKVFALRNRLELKQPKATLELETIK